MAEDPNRKFQEQLRSLVSERTDGGETITDIPRIRVEQIGEELGMTPREACTQFFALRGSVWDVVDLERSTIRSKNTSLLPPPRNWLGINGIYLVI